MKERLRDAQCSVGQERYGNVFIFHRHAVLSPAWWSSPDSWFGRYEPPFGHNRIWPLLMGRSTRQIIFWPPKTGLVDNGNGHLSRNSARGQIGGSQKLRGRISELLNTGGCRRRDVEELHPLQGRAKSPAAKPGRRKPAGNGEDIVRNYLSSPSDDRSAQQFTYMGFVLKYSSGKPKSDRIFIPKMPFY